MDNLQNDPNQTSYCSSKWRQMGRIFPYYIVEKIRRICRHFETWWWLLNNVQEQDKVRTNARQYFEKMDTTTIICAVLIPSNTPINFFRLIWKYSTEWSPLETTLGRVTALDIAESDHQKAQTLTLQNSLLQPQRHASKARNTCRTPSLYIKGEVWRIFRAFGTPC